MTKIDFYTMIEIYMILYVNYLTKKDLEEIQKSNKDIAAALVYLLQPKLMLRIKESRTELWRSLLPRIKGAILDAGYISYEAKRQILGDTSKAQTKTEFKKDFEQQPILGNTYTQLTDVFVKNDISKTAGVAVVAKATGDEPVFGLGNYAGLAQTIAAAALSYGSEQVRKVDKEVYVAILDNRTTQLCRGLNGGIYNKGEGPIPPMHWRCRSKRVPYTGEAIPTYDAFVRNLPEDLQQDILGNNMGLLSGTLAGFVDYREKDDDFLIKSIDDFQERIDNLITVYQEE